MESWSEEMAELVEDEFSTLERASRQIPSLFVVGRLFCGWRRLWRENGAFEVKRWGCALVEVEHLNSSIARSRMRRAVAYQHRRSGRLQV